MHEGSLLAAPEFVRSWVEAVAAATAL